MHAYIRPWLRVLSGSLRGRRDVVLENAALRQQLAMYERRRADIQDSDRLFWVWLVRIWPGCGGVVVAVKPERVVRSHRAGWRRYWTGKSRPRRRGRPRIDPEARELIMRLARENRRWGAVRITARYGRSDTRSAPRRSGASPARAAASAVSELAHVSSQPSTRNLGRRTSSRCRRSRSTRSTCSSSSRTADAVSSMST